MNPTDIIERLVSQLDDEIATASAAIYLLEEARTELLKFTNLPDRLVDTLADDLGIIAIGRPSGWTDLPPEVVPSAVVIHPEPATSARQLTPNTRQKYPLSDVADIWHSFNYNAKAGVRHKAISEQLGISIKGAEQAVIRARKKGLIPPTGAPVPAAEAAVEPAEPEPGNYDPDEVDWEDVAACYKQAIIDGRRPIAAISDMFDVAHHVANDWPKVCRRMGLLPPADQPQVQTEPAPHQTVRHTPGRPVAM